MSDIISIERLASRVAVLVWSDPGPANVLNEASIAALAEAVETVLGDDAVGAVVLASGKKEFVAGADLDAISRLRDLPAETALEEVMRLHAVLRRMETGGKPFVAAINGAALGGGYEVALACHVRLVADDPRVRIGLPEAQLGLFPGGGGTQRLPRLIGLREALGIITQGKTVDPTTALSLGMVSGVVPAAELRDAAVREAERLIGAPVAQPWDRKGFKVPGGDLRTPVGFETFVGANGQATKASWGNYPAIPAALAAVYHGLSAPIEQGCRIEAREFVRIARGDVAQAMVGTLFHGANAARKAGERIAASAPEGTGQRIGVLGAGLMGAGIAYAAASAGLDVVLLDATPEAAERGRAYAASIDAARARKGRGDPEKTARIMSRIVATTDYADLRGCGLVVEAVFENREIKAKVIEQAEAVLASDAVFASNTSTIPIASLAQYSARPDRLLGLHFFSPVEKMPLVEVVRASRTSEEALAIALKFVTRLGKTPIVVGDGRGFYTTRVFSAYLTEGVAMLAEGVPPALIENAGRLAGMPMGPLRVADMVSLELVASIAAQTRSDLGDAYREHPSEPVIAAMLDTGRKGEKGGKGFYDYDVRRLSPALRTMFPLTGGELAVADVVERLLLIQVAEALRCVEDGVIQEARDLDVGSVFGWGFCPFRGGVASYVRSLGAERLSESSARLTAQHGDRFALPAKLPEFATHG